MVTRIMRLGDIIAQIENVSKKEIQRVAPTNCREIQEIISGSTAHGVYEKMVIGYLTSLCAEYMAPDVFHLERDGLDYIGFELEDGTITAAVAGDKLGTCMKKGTITAEKAGDGAGEAMTGGLITASEIKSIGNTIGGTIKADKVDNLSKHQGAEIFIGGVRIKRGFLDRLFRR